MLSAWFGGVQFLQKLTGQNSIGEIGVPRVD
jgi:hypothetical protein